MAVDEDVVASLALKFQAIFPHLDERQRRLLAGAEARSLGHGGIRAVAQAAGMREGTVSDGVAELESGTDPLGRIRRAGGGRKQAREVDPGLVPAMLALVEPDLRGDPMSPLRWTTKSTRNLARELSGAGHRVSTADRILATVLYLRKLCTQAVLAELFAVDKGTIGRAVQEISPLLDRHGYAITPSTARFPSPADLTAYLATGDPEPKPEIKPAC